MYSGAVYIGIPIAQLFNGDNHTLYVLDRHHNGSLDLNGLPIILLGSYLPGKPRSHLFRHLFTILKAAKSSGPSVLLHACRTM